MVGGIALVAICYAVGALLSTVGRGLRDTLYASDERSKRLLGLALETLYDSLLLASVTWVVSYLILGDPLSFFLSYVVWFAIFYLGGFTRISARPFYPDHPGL